MAINISPKFRLTRLCALSWLVLFFPCFSFAQNSPASAGNDFVGSDSGENSFRVVDTPEGPRIIQRLSWIRDENDFRYEVIIEQQNENGAYTQILRQSRPENFIEISLVPGRYRYRVLVYNLLDRLEYSTNWSGFSIARARHPALRRISPDRFTLTGDAWVIELEGTNLLPESELSLRPLDGGDPVLPGEYTAFPDGNGGRVVFYSANLAAGRYELCVRNPGGFEARRDCDVGERFPFDVFVSASYAPAAHVYGYLNDLFDAGMYPLGLSLRADVLLLKKDWGDIGAEAVLWWHYFSAEKNDLEASAHFWGFHVNLLYQYNLSSRLILGARLGGGQVSVVDLSYAANDTAQDPISTWMPALNGGLSLKWLFHPRFFAELGLDYVNAFSADGPQGFLLPFIGVGWKR